LRIDERELELDAPLSDGLVAEDEIQGAKSRYTLIVSLARRERRRAPRRCRAGRSHLAAARALSN
jgi:hypothetical protein